LTQRQICRWNGQCFKLLRTSGELPQRIIELRGIIALRVDYMDEANVIPGNCPVKLPPQIYF
jgi:hypothetical protein